MFTQQAMKFENEDGTDTKIEQVVVPVMEDDDAAGTHTEETETPVAETAEKDENVNAVPVKKYVEEKKKRQATELELEVMRKRVTELENMKSYDSETEQYLRDTNKELLDSGLDPVYADVFSKKLAELKKDMLATKNREPVVDGISVEIMKLKNQDETGYYDNADAFADQIREKMKVMGVSAEDAYNMIVKPATRIRELEQRRLAEGNKDTRNNASSVRSSASKPNGSAGLPQEEMDALRAHNMMFPENPYDVKKWKEVMYRQK